MKRENFIVTTERIDWWNRFCALQMRWEIYIRRAFWQESL